MPYTFGLASTKRLNTCHPDIIRIMRSAIILSKCDFTVVDGRRGEAEQTIAFAEGKSKARYGKSPHNFVPVSLAVDIAPFFEGIIQWDNKELFAEIANAVHEAQDDLFDRGIIAHKLENGFEQWGWDAPHWQIIGWKGLK